MEKLPRHCEENSMLFRRNDYTNLEQMSCGVKTSLKFNKVPDFYVIDDKEYFAVEMKIEGLKVGTAALATENMLNIKLHDAEGLSQVRNLNFLIPPEADARKVSVEILNNDVIFMRAPLKRKQSAARRGALEHRR